MGLFAATEGHIQQSQVSSQSEGILDGSVSAMVMLGGNLVRAHPDRQRMEAVWPSLELTDYITVKLNRTHLTPAKLSCILSCLGMGNVDARDFQVILVAEVDGQA